MFEGTAPGAYSILIHAYDERLCATPAYGLRDGCEKIGPGPSLPCELSTGPTWHQPRGRHLIISSLLLLLLLQSPPSSHQQHQHQHHHHLTITITTVIDSDRLTVEFFSDCKSDWETGRIQERGSLCDELNLIGDLLQ